MAQLLWHSYCAQCTAHLGVHQAVGFPLWEMPTVALVAPRWRVLRALPLRTEDAERCTKQVLLLLALLPAVRLLSMVPE